MVVSAPSFTAGHFRGTVAVRGSGVGRHLLGSGCLQALTAERLGDVAACLLLLAFTVFSTSQFPWADLAWRWEIGGGGHWATVLNPIITTPSSGQFRRQCMQFGSSAGNFGGSVFRRPFRYFSACGLSKLVALLPNSMLTVHNWSGKGVDRLRPVDFVGGRDRLIQP